MDGDSERFYSIALQVAASEAKRGHGRVATDIKALVDKARQLEQPLAPFREGTSSTGIREELQGLLSVAYPRVLLSAMVLGPAMQEKLRRILRENRQQGRLRSYGLQPRNKLLLVGPPGSGKTMTASVLAGELDLPLLSIRLDGLITRYLGETAAKLRLIFDAMLDAPGVYLFDEFDAIGSRRLADNDVGEIRRVLNSFLQFLEADTSKGLIIAATNHPAMLDQALFRRFDDVIEFEIPDPDIARGILEAVLAAFDTSSVDWEAAVHQAMGLSQAELSRAAEESAKSAILEGHTEITTVSLLHSLEERKQANRHGVTGGRTST